MAGEKGILKMKIMNTGFSQTFKSTQPFKGAIFVDMSKADDEAKIVNNKINQNGGFKSSGTAYNGRYVTYYYAQEAKANEDEAAMCVKALPEQARAAFKLKSAMTEEQYQDMKQGDNLAKNWYSL